MGPLFVLLALGTAVGSGLVAVFDSRRSSLRVLGTGLLAVTAAGLTAAIVVLTTAIMRLDTSFAYVADQTRPDMSLALRFSALWSGAEGSLLLFAAMVVAVLLIGHREAPPWQRIGVALIAAGLCVAVFIGANPFDRLTLPPLSGAGMAPILEHYAMIIHPPMLYAGLCLALAPALVRDIGRAHRLALASLVLLTMSLGFGSAWAYVELGWGGWWAWDPIENVALIVWLLLAAGLHWQPLDRPNGTGSGLLGAVTLWALCWPAVLGGAAMTRTSLRTSVHAFADAADLAVWLWPLTALAGIGLGLRVWEERPKHAGSLPTRLPQIMLFTAAFIIAAGTYRPFIGGDGTAGFFYSRSLYPIAIVGCVLIGIVPLLGSRDRIPSLLARFGIPAAIVATAVCVAVGWRSWFQHMLAAALGFACALVVASGRAGAARLAGHLGVLLILFGALAGTASTETAVWLQEGQPTMVDGHRIELIGTEIISDDPLRAEARVLVDDAYELEPSVAVFADRNLRLPEVSTRTRPWLDSQAILRDVDQDAGALITLLFRPWNQLVWWGVALLTVAALLLLVGGESRANRDVAKPNPARASDARAGSSLNRPS